MPERSRKPRRPRDPNQLAKFVVETATARRHDRTDTPNERAKIPPQLLWADWVVSREARPGHKVLRPTKSAILRGGQQRRVGRTSHAMTINVGLVTSEAFILGCDSTASTGDLYLDPLAIGLEKDSAGKTVMDGDGRVTVKFKFEHLQNIITDAWGGVTKMFPLCSRYCTVAAVTSGAASLNGRTISSLAGEYHSKPKALRVGKAAAKQPRTVKEVAEGFLAFMRTEYEEHYKNSTMPEPAREGPEFLIGGFGQNDKFPAAYRVRVKENTCDEEFASGDAGLVWNAQSDAVSALFAGTTTRFAPGLSSSRTRQLKAIKSR
jgi:hypothetical protein